MAPHRALHVATKPGDAKTRRSSSSKTSWVFFWVGKQTKKKCYETIHKLVTAVQVLKTKMIKIRQLSRLSFFCFCNAMGVPSTQRQSCLPETIFKLQQKAEILAPKT